MATINGVEITSISSYNGKPLSSISVISGLQTINIPGWPGQITCITLSLGFADPRRGMLPTDACSAEMSEYPFDNTNQILFFPGSCNSVYAQFGYYSDGTTIYSWNDRGWGIYDTCVTVGPVNTVAPSIPVINTSVYQNSKITGDRGTWTVTGTASWVYNWYSNGTLIKSESSPIYNPKTGTWDDVQPSLNVNYNWLFTNIHLEVVGTDDTGTGTPVSSNSQIFEDLDLNTFLTNSGVGAISTILALEYLQKQLRVTYVWDWLFDYYPFVGSTENEMKWSLKNPNNYFVFSPGWSFTYYGAKADSTFNSVGTWANSNFIFTNSTSYATDIGMYNGFNIVEDSYDVLLVSGNSMNLKIQLDVSNEFKWGKNNGNVMNFSYPIGSSLGHIGIASTGEYGNISYQAFQNGSLLGSPTFGRNDYFWNMNLRIGSGVDYTNGDVLKPGNKLYQFVYTGHQLNSNSFLSTLNDIIATFQQMLGR